MMRRLDLEVANHSKNSPDKVTVDTSGDSNCCACRIACNCTAQEESIEVHRYIAELRIDTTHMYVEQDGRLLART